MRYRGPRKIGASLSLASGTLVGQAALFLTSLVTVRLFTPEEMGSFATLSAVAACLVALSTGRYEMAVPLPSSNADSITLARMSIVLASLFGMVLALVLLAARANGVQGWFADVLAYVWAVPLLTVGLALFQVGSHLAIRSEDYSAIAWRSVLYPLVTGALQIGAGLLSTGSAGLVLSLVAGQTTAFLAMWIPAKKALQLDTGEHTPWSELARKYARFPTFLSFSGVLNALSFQLPLILVSYVFGLQAAGQFGIAMKIVSLPVTLVGQSVGYVYTGRASKQHRTKSGGIWRLYKISSLKLAILALIAGLGIYAWAPSVFPILLGDTWAQAGVFAQLMSLAVVGQIVAAPLSQTLTIAHMHYWQLAVDAMRVVALVLAGVAATAMGWTAETSVFLMSVVIFLSYGVLWAVNCYAAKRIDLLTR